MKKPNVIMSSRKRTNRTVAISCVFMCHPVANTLRATNWNVHTSDIKGMFSNHKFFSSLHLKKSIVFIFKVYQKEWCCRIKIGKKKYFDHSTLAKVWFWQSNSKIRYLWSSNYQTCSNMTLRLFWWVVLFFIYGFVLKS
jgi:hypothetical protein